MYQKREEHSVQNKVTGRVCRSSAFSFAGLLTMPTPAWLLNGQEGANAHAHISKRTRSKSKNLHIDIHLLIPLKSFCFATKGFHS